MIALAEHKMKGGGTMRWDSFSGCKRRTGLICYFVLWLSTWMLREFENIIIHVLKRWFSFLVVTAVRTSVVRSLIFAGLFCPFSPPGLPAADRVGRRTSTYAHQQATFAITPSQISSSTLI
jgi:hypothetical protein